MKLTTVMKLFGSPSDWKKNSQLCYQDLLDSDMLTRYEDLPLASFVVFVSHQWLGYDHPDPLGIQMKTLSTSRIVSCVGEVERWRDGYGDGSDAYDFVQTQVHDKGQGMEVDAEAYVFLGRLV